MTYCSRQTICRSSRRVQPSGQQPRHQYQYKQGLEDVRTQGCFAWLLCAWLYCARLLVSRLNVVNTNAASQPKSHSQLQLLTSIPQQASATTDTRSLLVALIHASRMHSPGRSHWGRFGPRSHLFRINDFPQDRSFILASRIPSTIKPSNLNTNFSPPHPPSLIFVKHSRLHGVPNTARPAHPPRIIFGPGTWMRQRGSTTSIYHLSRVMHHNFSSGRCLEIFSGPHHHHNSATVVVTSAMCSGGCSKKWLRNCCCKTIVRPFGRS